jgi:hypothetical protein
MKTLVITAVAVILILGVLGVAAHSFDVIGMLKRIHGH